MLVELKARRIDRPHRSDVIELSAQQHALQAETGESVPELAYVLTQHPETGRKTAHRVRLLSFEEVVALAERRGALLVGRIVAKAAYVPGLCAKCAFLGECTAANASWNGGSKSKRLGQECRRAPERLQKTNARDNPDVELI